MILTHLVLFKFTPGATSVVDLTVGFPISCPNGPDAGVALTCVNGPEAGAPITCMLILVLALSIRGGRRWRRFYS